MKKNALSLFIMLTTLTGLAQTGDYYYQIPKAPDTYTATTVAARLVDGLGFRYYWASYGLTEKDLSFKPSDSARTTLETLEHIYGLTNVLLNTVSKRPSTPVNLKFSYEELRKKTLENIQTASELLKAPDANPEDFNMIFQRDSNRTEYPFWNLINGPVSDALWHVGQVVTFRRSSGNPLPPGVEVLQGRKRE